MAHVRERRRVSDARDHDETLQHLRVQFPEIPDAELERLAFGDALRVPGEPQRPAQEDAAAAAPKPPPRYRA